MAYIADQPMETLREKIDREFLEICKRVGDGFAKDFLHGSGALDPNPLTSLWRIDYDPMDRSAIAPDEDGGDPSAKWVGPRDFLSSLAPDLFAMLDKWQVDEIERIVCNPSRAKLPAEDDGTLVKTAHLIPVDKTYVDRVRPEVIRVTRENSDDPIYWIENR